MRGGVERTGWRPAHRSRWRILGAGVLAALAVTVATAVVAAAGDISEITVDRNCFSPTTSGTLTVEHGQDGHSITLGVYARGSGSGIWRATGAETTVHLETGQTEYPYTISIPPKYLTTPSTWLRVEVAPAVSGVGGATTGSSGGYEACSPPPDIPESPLAAGFPIAGILIFAGGAVVAVRRRRNSAVSG